MLTFMRRNFDVETTNRKSVIYHQQLGDYLLGNDEPVITDSYNTNNTYVDVVVIIAITVIRNVHAIIVQTADYLF